MVPVPQGCVPLAALPPGREVVASNGVIWSAEDVNRDDFGVALAQVWLAASARTTSPAAWAACVWACS